MDRLAEFLDAFYEAISFESVDKFDADRFANMFTRDALLAERTGETLCTETISDYMRIFAEEAERFPEHYNYGLKEIPIGFERINGEDYVLVRSEYEKHITASTTDGASDSVVHGCNFMTLCRDGDWFKILTLAWTAPV